MNILALDTSTAHAALAVATTAGTFTATPDPAARHGRNLVPAIRDLLRQAGLSPRALGLIAVGLGPGSYTGLRVGVTAAKTLAFAAGAELVGFDSLEAIARNAPGDERRVCVVADAQRGDLYVADFVRETPSAPLGRLGPTRIEAMVDWAKGLPPGTFVLGPAADRARSLAGEGWSFPEGSEAHWPDGSRLIELARELARSGHRDEPWFVEPHYLRRSAAEDQWDGLKGPASITVRPDDR